MFRIVFTLILFHVFGIVACSSETYSLALDTSFTFNLRNYTPSGSTQYWEATKILPPNSQFLIQVLDIPETVSFIVIQAHSYLFNVFLSPISSLQPKLFINGTNIGLVYPISTPRTATLFLQNQNVFNVTTMVVVSPYTKKAPIPGGCNLEFPTYTAPYLDVSYDNVTVVVGGQPAMIPQDPLCLSPSLLSYEMYQLYTTERDFSAETYFAGMKSMLTPEAASVGSLVRESVNGSPLKRVFGAYKGTGSIYTLVVRNLDGTPAVYVPAHTFACRNAFNNDSCQTLSSTFSNVLCALAVFIGLGLCLAGHFYFLFELFLMGSAIGGLLAYGLLNIRNTTQPIDFTVESTAIGILCGLIWCIVWWLVHSPILSVSLPLLNLGFMIASIIFFTGISDFPVFEGDANYWLTFVSIALTVYLLLLAIPRVSNMLSCSVIGGYIVVLPIDYYAGTNLHYIIVNVMYRAIAEDFNVAKTAPPFQTPDVILVIGWVVLAFSGMISQLKLSHGRPPFPPPCRLCSRESSELTTPLLVEARFTHYSPGSDNVFYA